MQELSTTEDPKGFQNFLRMGKTDFQELLAKMTPHIQRQDTWMREAISAAERLPITLRYLATADPYHSLEYLYRIPVSTLSTLIPETCRAIYDCLIEGWQVLKFILQSAFYSAEGCISFSFLVIIWRLYVP